MNAKIFLLMSLFSLSCVTSKEQEVTLADGVSEDQEYSTIYEKTTSKYEVIEQCLRRLEVCTPQRAMFRQILEEILYRNLAADISRKLQMADGQDGRFLS